MQHKPEPAKSASDPTDPRQTLDPSLRTRCEIWTRVMGYHRPVSSFNIGKKGEFHERKFFNEPAGHP